MRQVTFNESISEIEIHPPDTYQTFKALAKSSFEELDPTKFIDLKCCPACGSTNIQAAFTIAQATYHECEICDSLFIKKRPNPNQMRWYLEESKTAKYRKTSEYLAAMAANYAKLSSYRASWISATTLRIPVDEPLRIIDIETRSKALIQSIHQQIKAEVLTIQPAFPPSAPGDKPLSLHQIADETANIVTAFDVFEHQYSPQQFLQSVFTKTKPGGCLLLTTRAGSGFDIQVLRGACSTIVPLEHLNLFSVEGILRLLNQLGFEILEISTPGQLDVQIVEQVSQTAENDVIPQVIRYFLKNRDQYAKQKLQQFLQANLLSSHLRLVAQKRT